MVRLLLGLDAVPSPNDAADALAVAICHVHSSGGVTQRIVDGGRRPPRSWRSWRPPTGSRPS
jgi:crossover junction endodeoxyribonuclease RuvC